MLFVGHFSPKFFEGLQLEEIMTFMIVFMGSPACVKNPFVRSRIAEVCASLLSVAFCGMLTVSVPSLHDTSLAMAKVLSSPVCIQNPLVQT